LEFGQIVVLPRPDDAAVAFGHQPFGPRVALPDPSNRIRVGSAVVDPRRSRHSLWIARFPTLGGFDYGKFSVGPVANNGWNPKGLWQGKIPPDTSLHSLTGSSVIRRKTKLVTVGPEIFVSRLD
jgi:hypothetical protein